MSSIRWMNVMFALVFVLVLLFIAWQVSYCFVWGDPTAPRYWVVCDDD